MTLDVDYCRMAVGMIVGGWLLERDCWRETVGGRMFVGGYILKEVKPDGSPLLINARGRVIVTPRFQGQ